MKINKADIDNFSLGLNISLIPTVLMNLEVANIPPGDPRISVGAKVAIILHTKSTLVRNVTALRASPAPNYSTYFPYGIACESGFYTALIRELFATVDPDLGAGNLSVSANPAYEYTIWEGTFPFKDACFLYGDSKNGHGVLRNTSAARDWVFDVQKI